MFAYLSIFWWIRTTKIVLFYLYLWQLKEYHLGRFLDHFRTGKGKKLLLNKLIFLKILFFLSVFFFLYFPFLSNYPSLFAGLFSLYSLLPSILLFLYLVESLKAFKDSLQRKLRFPVLTKKTAFLILVALGFSVLIPLTFFSFGKDLEFFAFWLLTIDIFTPAIASAIVLIFQPLTVLLRNKIIEKAKLKRENFKDLIVIGICGSYGKTSTKEFLFTILSQKFNVLKTKAHQNSEVGISQCVLEELKGDHQIFIVEMGAYGKGGIKLLSDIVKPKIGILMGANEQHLALFGSMENLISAEGGKELIESLPEDGLVIFNGDNRFALELYQTTDKPKKIFSAWPKNLNFLPDLWAEGIIPDKKSLFFKACQKEGCYNFKVYLAGSHFISNLLAAILIANELKMTFEEISDACLKIEPQEKTMKVLEGKYDLTIIDDSYSANPDSVFAALDYLKLYLEKKIIVMPCLIELGKASNETHKKIGEKIGQICNLAIICTKEKFSQIRKGALEVGFEQRNIFFEEDPEKIFWKIIDFSQGQGVILLEGRVPEKLINLLIKK